FPGRLVFLKNHSPLLEPHIRPPHAGRFPWPTARELEEDQEPPKGAIRTPQQNLEFFVGHGPAPIRSPPAPQLGEWVPLHELHFYPPIKRTFHAGNNASAVRLGSVLGVLVKPALEVIRPALCDPKLAAGLVKPAEDT